MDLEARVNKINTMLFSETQYEDLICPSNIIQDMDAEQFKQWLKLDMYGNASDYYDKDMLLSVYDRINSVAGFEDKELIVLNLLSSCTF